MHGLGRDQRAVERVIEFVFASEDLVVSDAFMELDLNDGFECLS